jgi:prepilin-type N-terminal cleavage/methylation domain-containing protein
MIARSTTRPGFTLIEIAVSSVLLAMLVVVMGRIWYGMLRPTTYIAARARIDEEAALTAASLSRDLGGFYADTDGRTGIQALYKFVGRQQVNNTQLWLCFDGGSPPNGVADWAGPDVVIDYELDGNSLVRRNQFTNTTFGVAKYVQNFQVVDLGDRVQIQVTFSYRGLIQTYTMVARDP